MVFYKGSKTCYAWNEEGGAEKEPHKKQRDGTRGGEVDRKVGGEKKRGRQQKDSPRQALKIFRKCDICSIWGDLELYCTDTQRRVCVSVHGKSSAKGSTCLQSSCCGRQLSSLKKSILHPRSQMFRSSFRLMGSPTRRRRPRVKGSQFFFSLSLSFTVSHLHIPQLYFVLQA